MDNRHYSRAFPDAGSAPPIPDAQVAQLVEHATENRSVGGSTPSLGTIFPVCRPLDKLGSSMKTIGSAR